MNRKNQGQPGRQNMQPHPKGSRPQTQNRNSYDQSGHEMNHNHDRNFSGDSSWSNGDTNFDSHRNTPQTYRDTDYDLDGATYGQQGRSPRSMERNFGGRMPGMEYGSTGNEFDSNRNPLRYDRDENVFSSRLSPDRHASSSERFGYPSNMNAWSGADHANYSGNSQSRMEQNPSSNVHPHYSYGDAGPASFGSFGEERSNQKDWGSQSTSRSFHGKGPKGYKRSDERIKEDVCETLSRDHRIDASDIEVNVEDAMVTLSGNVDSREIKRAAEMIIENLSGVDDVKNDIRVKKAGEMNNDSLHASGSNKISNLNSSSKSSTTKSSGHI